jgi:hypothetical protein
MPVFPQKEAKAATSAANEIFLKYFGKLSND